MGMLCQGKLLLTDAEQSEIREIEGRVLSGYKSAKGEALALIGFYKDKFDVGPLFDRKSFAPLETTEQLAQALTWVMRLRKTHIKQPCDYDLTGIIQAGPWDGQEYEYECPSCGNTGTFINEPEN